MYTTVKKYQFGVEESCHINTAILETLRAPNNKTAMVIHAYQDTFLVEQDLGPKYKLDETTLLYQTRELSNFKQFKAGAAPKPVYATNIFMLDITTGLWQQRYPKYAEDEDQIHYLLMKDENPNTQHDESWCVNDMLTYITNPDSYVIRSYCRPVPVNYSNHGIHADMIVWNDDDYDVVQHKFDAAFRISKIQWQNKKANTL